jgi:hypothetical protein
MNPTIVNPPTPDEARALARKNYVTAAWIGLVIVGMMALSYFGRFLMVPVLFKT